MVSNNQYYKAIAELLNEEEYTGEHNDGYYLKRIVEHYGVSYSKVKCKGKYLKDWARAILGTVTGSHANNYYLKNIAEALTSVEYSWRSENRYLKIILNNISAPSLVVSSDKSILSYADSESATLTATLRSGDNVGKTITFYNVTDDVQLGTGVTDSDGVAVCNSSYNSQGIGDVEFEASYGSLVTETFVVQDLPLYIKGDVANTSLFDIDNRKILNNASRGTVSLTTDGEYNVMTISGNGNYALIEMPVLSAIKSPFKISFIQDMNSGTYNGVTLENSTVYLFHYLKTTYRIVQSSTGYSSQWNVKSNESTPNGQYRQEVSILGSSAKIELIDMSNESVVYTKTISLPSNLNIESNNVRVGIHLVNPATFKFKEFKVEPL